MYWLIFTSRINARCFLKKTFVGGEEGSGPIEGRWKGKSSERGPTD